MSGERQDDDFLLGNARFTNLNKATDTMTTKQNKILIVGAGLSGSVLARQLAEANLSCVVIDRRENIAGMCYSSRDEETGIDVHRFGPHIFHTSDERVWSFVNRFDHWAPWVNQIKANNAKGVFSMPINLQTINQLFGANMNPMQAKEFIKSKQDKSIIEPKNAEEQLLRFVGSDIYETFFRDYSTKQWGVSPRELSADIIKRIPVRFNYSDNYYFDKYQGFPMSGYTQWVANMLKHELIELRMQTAYDPSMKDEYAHVFYSGPLDEYFEYSEGDLSYRTVDFKYERGMGDLQGCGCMNYTDMSVPYTRAHEHKYFSPWESHEKSVLLYEYSREASRDDDRFYPKRMPEDMLRLTQYMKLAEKEEKTSFIGRLGCYRYLDMHHVIAISLDYAQAYLSWRDGSSTPLSKWATSPC